MRAFQRLSRADILFTLLWWRLKRALSFPFEAV